MSGKMGRVISLVNQKGGVGKTTVSINLSAALGKLGKRTLLVDLDPQGNTSTGLGINKSDINGKSSYECLIGAVDPRDAIIKTRFTNLFVMPATINLAGVDYEFRDKNDANFKTSEQLKKVIDQVKKGYDYIIIDCPPQLGTLTINALVASDSLIIPVQCEFFALEGITQLLNTIINTQKKLNPRLQVEGVLLTMLDSRTNLGMEVVEEVRSFFGDKTFDTIIPRLIRLVEAPSHGEPINVYDPENRATIAFHNLAKEVIKRDERK
jgi:chromosome partitioning protein